MSARPTAGCCMTGLHTCANCHSFSRDGKTLGMDLDGPQERQRAVRPQPDPPANVDPQRGRDRVELFRGQATGRDESASCPRFHRTGQYVVTTIKHPQWELPNPRRNCPSANPVGSAASEASETLAEQLLRGQFQGLSLSPGVLSDARDPGLVQPRDGQAATAARRRRPALRADQRGLESRREVPGLRPGGGTDAVSRRLETRRVCQRSERRPRSSTTSTASRSTGAKAGAPSRSPALRATA